MPDLEIFRLFRFFLGQHSLKQKAAFLFTRLGLLIGMMFLSFWILGPIAYSFNLMLACYTLEKCAHVYDYNMPFMFPIGLVLGHGLYLCVALLVAAVIWSSRFIVLCYIAAILTLAFLTKYDRFETISVSIALGFCIFGGLWLLGFVELTRWQWRRTLQVSSSFDAPSCRTS